MKRCAIVVGMGVQRRTWGRFWARIGVKRVETDRMADVGVETQEEKKEKVEKKTLDGSVTKFLS